MNQTYTAVVKQDAPCWIGWVEEVPGVNCQEHTKSELLNSLRTTLVEALKMNRDEACNAAGADYEELHIAVWSVPIFCAAASHEYSGPIPSARCTFGVS